MNTFTFTLVLGGVDENTPELEDKLYDASCDDALVNFRNGTVFLDFDREAVSLEDAIISAIKDVESAALNMRVIHVAPDDLVSESEIAKRLQISRQTVSLWIKGERRAGSQFPSPLMKLSEKSPLWRWSEVTQWLYNSQIISDKTIVESALLIENVNSALEERNTKVRKLRQQLLKKLAA